METSTISDRHQNRLGSALPPVANRTEFYGSRPKWKLGGSGSNWFVFGSKLTSSGNEMISGNKPIVVYSGDWEEAEILDYDALRWGDPPDYTWDSPENNPVISGTSGPRMELLVPGSELAADRPFGIILRKQKIDDIVKEAKESLLGFVNDWDGEHPFTYEEETINTASLFLHELVEKSDAPEIMQVRILPSSQGSIDLHWKEAHFELLINFGADGSGNYYGDDYNGSSIRGKNSYPKPGFIACWMENILNG